LSIFENIEFSLIRLKKNIFTKILNGYKNKLQTLCRVQSHWKKLKIITHKNLTHETKKNWKKPKKLISIWQFDSYLFCMHLFALFLTDLKSAYSSEILFIPISIFKTIIFQLGPCLHFMKTSEKNLQAIEQDMKTIFYRAYDLI